jgi:hypothetical protein
MTSNRELKGRGEIHRAHRQSNEEMQLGRRRAEMHAAEGHAGSIPRGNQEREHEQVGHRHREWERVLGH